MCCQPLCFIFFLLLFLPGQRFLGIRGAIKVRSGLTEDPRVVGVETGRLVAPLPLVMRWSLIDLSMWSHLAQKDGAPTCSSSQTGRGVMRRDGVGDTLLMNTHS